MLLHEIVEIVNHMDDVRLKRGGNYTHRALRYSHACIHLLLCYLLLPQFYSRITSFKVRMALIEVIAYTTSNPITVTQDSSATLTLWKTHFRDNIHQNVPADAGLLFA